MHGKKKIIERIKKLFAMAKGGTIHEKEIAIFQAQRLMAKHHIDFEDVEKIKKDKVTEVMSDINVRKHTWVFLASIIADNFRCKVFFTSGYSTRINPVFLGFETDAEVAKEIFEQAYEFANSESNRIAAYHSYHHGTAKGVRDEWVVGFINGLEEGFKQQVSNVKETALMVVIPQEVEDDFNTREWADPKDTAKPLGVRRNGDQNLYRAGYNNGYEFAHGRKQQALNEEI